MSPHDPRLPEVGGSVIESKLLDENHSDGFQSHSLTGTKKALGLFVFGCIEGTLSIRTATHGRQKSRVREQREHHLNEKVNTVHDTYQQLFCNPPTMNPVKGGKKQESRSPAGTFKWLRKALVHRPSLVPPLGDVKRTGRLRLLTRGTNFLQKRDKALEGRTNNESRTRRGVPRSTSRLIAVDDYGSCEGEILSFRLNYFVLTKGQAQQIAPLPQSLPREN